MTAKTRVIGALSVIVLIIMGLSIIAGFYLIQAALIEGTILLLLGGFLYLITEYIWPKNKTAH